MKMGPGFLIAAAFIGPGTVTTATMAGAQFGYALLWAVIFSVLATIILQEMAARLGVITHKGLAELLNQQFQSPLLKWFVIGLIVAAIGIGNAAYEAGNLTGAAMGLHNLLGGELPLWSLALGAIAALTLANGNTKSLQTVLTILVMLMSLVFIVTFVIADVDYAELFGGMFVPQLPDASILTTIALIGTTVVPYNLFLHASLAAKHKTDSSPHDRLKHIQKDSALAISIGGLVTLAIVSTSAATWFGSSVAPQMDSIAEQLRPLLGDYAPAFFALGLFCAGLTSAITAPLATSYALCGALGKPTDPDSKLFKFIWLSVILFGSALCFLAIKPISIILLAQAANGLLLPLIAVCLLWFCNQANLLGQFRNKLWHNVLGTTVVLTVSGLGFFKLISLF
ncbi:Nramp family divalent metal transporter [Planctobacterium marinum]